ncbi:Possible restriction endonuclease [uncultured Candidatus Thioglobus sp.]|nr:Possible restriction endonuclease [uncultured Candidatus Thioglobus sp.]
MLNNLFNKENNATEDKQFFFEGKEIERSVKTRINQSFFRDAILSSYNFKYCLTGIDIPALLIANHIVPWSKDPKNRLNPKNGLCLNNLHDQAFDRGYITFDNQLRLVLSRHIVKSKEKYIQKYFKELEGKSLRLPDRALHLMNNLSNIIIRIYFYMNNKLYAIYKNGFFKGNERGSSTSDAIKKYVIALLFEDFLTDKKFISQYSAKIAIKGTHYKREYRKIHYNNILFIQ